MSIAFVVIQDFAWFNRIFITFCVAFQTAGGECFRNRNK